RAAGGAAQSDGAGEVGVGGRAGSADVAIVHVLEVWAGCCGRPDSRTGGPRRLTSAACGIWQTITSDVSTGNALLSVIVRPVAAGAAAAGTRISGGCHRVLVPVAGTVCAAPLVWVQVAPTGAVVVLQTQPHIGTEAPSGISAVWRAAVRLTVFCACATPTVASSAIPASRARFTKSCWVFMFCSVPSQRFVDVPDRRIHQHHHQHPAGKHVVGRDLALVMRVPHEGDAGFLGRVLQRAA